ncbi:MAG: bifunctional UDP-N-acetylglucosamine diphosphorylase/glucosamine-1-phosphate N-acetyltransferase GlmU [Deltaproteobacteria bacterium]|nr:bifunctional UDP-N-acetylglucosamine diphosphorylase/glucosamine-1-phosphate N-acetyltransferase GlmU [Deltaproteobacteria bacterium]
MSIPSTEPRTVIILAAGQGTRMKSTLPKVLHRIAGASLLVHAIQSVLPLSPERIVVVVGHGREQVESEVRARFGDLVTFAVQSQQRGTADAVRAAIPMIPYSSTEVLITYGDCPLVPTSLLKQLLDERAQSVARVSVATAEISDPTGYGRIVRDVRGHVTAIREHKDCTPAEREITLINAGLYAMDRAFLERGLAAVSSDNAQGEFYLTDLVAMAARESERASAGAGCIEVRGRANLLRGINDRVELADAEVSMLEIIHDRWRRAGNTIARGARIECDVVLEGDVTVAQGAVLRGKTVVRTGSVVDVGCILEDAIVDVNVLLKPYSIVVQSEVGARAQIGPFAHVRPASVIGEDAHVGNFVELKKTRMGRGAKANHLAYLGDGVIGERANIGAGTIFCNYDGFQKHTTTIGEGAFVGSNSSLVAPVTIGDDAYVGSGSVVTRDVPSGALAVGRARQEIKEGYVARIRALKKKP